MGLEAATLDVYYAVMGASPVVLAVAGIVFLSLILLLERVA